VSSFSERLKHLRLGKSLTQKQMAEKFNITERGYQNYEIGKSYPNFESLIKLADFFVCSVDFLIGRTDNPEISPPLSPEDTPETSTIDDPTLPRKEEPNNE